MPNSIDVSSVSSSVWEDLVDDFLETACLLKPKERHYLLQELRRQRISVERIDAPTCLSVDGHLLVVSHVADRVKALWLYHPGLKKIKKMDVGARGET